MYANEDVKTNKKHKDKLFRFIFGSEENKRYLLDLYNAVNETNYTNLNDLEITTLEDVIYIKEKNDISFIIESEMDLYEHQSSYNPNMPLRGLMYFSDLYRQYLTKIGKDLYGSTIAKIPTPRYIVFYNGDTNVDDKVELKLSSAFENECNDGKYEWTATMLNINAGHNQKIMDKCKALRDYANFVADVKKYTKEMSIKKAIDKAVSIAIENNYLDGFFKTHREGVVNVSLTEYNEKEFIENRKAEGRAEGLAEGRAEGEEKLSTLIGNMIAEGLSDQIPQVISSVQRRQEMYEKYNL